MLWFNMLKPIPSSSLVVLCAYWLLTCAQATRSSLLTAFLRSLFQRWARIEKWSWESIGQSVKPETERAPGSVIKLETGRSQSVFDPISLNRLTEEKNNNRLSNECLFASLIADVPEYITLLFQHYILYSFYVIYWYRSSLIGIYVCM